MTVEIKQTVDNALFARKDVEFVIHHVGKNTPSRVEARQMLSTEVGTKTENVVIDHMESAYGMPATKGTARVYQSADAARATERKHLLKRNNLFQEKKEASE
ncbi:MAG: 30S ribosomal protein S24e [Thermoplasmatota archaeon]